MSNQILISSGAKLRDLDDVIIGTDGILSSLGFDVPYGVPRLDANGKILASELPNSVMEFKGVWNAATNTPTLTNGVGNAGDVYLCNVAGTVDFGAGPITFAVGDYAVYTGSVWARSSGAVGTVTSVAVSRSGDALAITGSPITTSGTINIGFTGNSSQYINGAGNLVTFPTIISEAQNLVTEVYNETGATLTKGTVVYINGGHGNLPTVTKAIATSDATSAQTYGVVRADITNNNNGYVTVIGSLNDLDTQAYPDGTQLYLSGTTAGAWTSTKPSAPIHLVYVGIVVRSHPTQGVVEVRIQNGYELDELHNVQIVDVANNDGIFYDSATSLWKNKTIAEVLGYTPANAATTLTINGTTYDLSANRTWNVGTVTSLGLSAPTGFSVTGSPVTSSGTLALSFAAGYSLPTTAKQSNWDDAYTWVAAFPTQTGNAGKFLTTDGSTLSWATNPLGTVTSVAMSVPTGLSVAGSPITTSGTLAVTFAAGYSIPTNASQANWDTAYTNRITSLTTTGSSGAATLVSNTLNIPNYTLAGLGGVPTSRTLTINGVTYDLSADRTWTITAGISSVSGTAPISVSTVSGAATVSISQATTSTNGYLSSTDWNTFNNKQNALTLTTTGSSGAATLVGATLNIPNYGSALSGYLPLTGGTLTGALNGTTATFSGAIQTNRLKLIESTYSTNFTLYTGVNNSNSIGFYNETSGIYNFIIASTGDATFSNKITAGSNIVLPSNYELVYGNGDVSILGNTSTNTLEFKTSNSTKVLITSTGRVGINTSNVNASLEVKNTTANEANLRLYNSYNSGSNQWGLEWFRDYDTASNSSAAYIKYFRDGGFDGKLIFGVGSVGSIATALTINSNKSANFASSITANAASQINGLAQDALQPILSLQGFNASSQGKSLYFRLTAGTPLWSINTGAAGADAAIEIKPDTSNGLLLPYGNSNITAVITNSTTYSSSSSGNVFKVRNAYASTGSYAGIQFEAEPASGNAATAAINVIAMGGGTADMAFTTRNASSTEEKMRLSAAGYLSVLTTNQYGRVTIANNVGSSRNFASAGAANLSLWDTTTAQVGVGGAIVFAGYKSAAGATGFFGAIEGVKESAVDGSEAGMFIVRLSNASGVFSKRLTVYSNGQLETPYLGGSGTVLISASNTGQTEKVTIGSGLSLSGGVLTATGGGSGTVSGSGTSGYIAKWSGTSSIANSNIYDDGSNVILGNTSPTASFKNTAWSTSSSNTTVIPTWPFYAVNTQSMTRYIMSFTDGGNGGTSTAGTGTTAYIEIGAYYTGRGVISMSGSGGSSPADQGTGRGKDLMVIAGQSDNTAGYVGGRLYLQGGSGYDSGVYGQNYGAVILQSLGGNVGIGGAPSYKLDVGGDIRAGGNLRATSSGSGLYLSGGNNRIYFSALRAMEGDATGTNLQIGEGYANTIMYNIVRIDGNSLDKPRLNLTYGSINVINMGDRTSSSGTTIGYLTLFNGNTAVIDFNGDSAGYSFMNAGNVVVGSSSQIYSSAKLQVNGDLYVSGSSIYVGGVTYSGVQTFNNTVNLNSTTNVATYQNVIWKGTSSATDFSMGNGGAGMYILSSAAIDLNAPIVQRNGLGYSFAGTSSAYNVLLLNSGNSIDEITILGGVRLTTTTAGMIFPRMTTTQLNTLSARGSTYCPNGTTVFDTTINILRTWNGSAWMNLW